AFDLARDVPTCSGARDGSCLSAAQKSAIGKIFAGPTLANGQKIYSSFAYDPGIVGASFSLWEFTAPLTLDSGALAMIWSVPPASPATFNGPQYALTTSVDAIWNQLQATNAPYTENAMSFMSPPNASNLAALKNRGGKMIVYHGVADSIFSADDTETWYKALQATHGGDASNFARYFPIPGMGHCSGGPSTDQFDALAALVDWVEQGRAPDAIVATARGAGNAGGVNAEVPANWSASRTRPLCPYPKVARYNGSGDVERAESFSCQ
ncbi:MAG: tannase/feruloyl esterase family alpha/beta hydrolase, partial [Anaerolineae bacterium]|nr:tannase/feruloyl esterase family alpha/beta hydrolase [Anaerolineae bacterium]